MANNIEELKTINGVEIPPHNNELDHWYKQLLGDIVKNGNNKGDRTGTGTKSVFGRMFRHSMKDGFPLLTSKKMHTKSIITELLWFLGVHMSDPAYNVYDRTNIKYLVDNGCNIWVGDAYKRYLKEFPDYLIKWWKSETSKYKLTALEIDNGALTRDQFINAIRTIPNFAAQWGDLGPIYGKQWCSWGDDEIVEVTAGVLCEGVKTLDEVYEAVENEACEVQKPINVTVNLGGLNQINQLISELKNNPDSRRLMVTAWNPNDLEASVLPPCHYGFQCYTRKLTTDERQLILKSKMGDVAYQQHLDDMVPFGGGSSEYYTHYDIPTRELSLAWNQRSVDVPLGLPFNIASYGFLLHMLTRITNMVPGELIGNLGDTHIYNDQLPFIGDQIANPTFDLPEFHFQEKKEYKHITDFHQEDFVIYNYQNAGKVDYPLSN